MTSMNVAGGAVNERIWPETEVQSLDDLFKQLDHARTKPERVFRGQCDAEWPLEPKLDRKASPETNYMVRLEEERALLKDFKGNSDRYLPPLEKSYLDRDPVLGLTVMQHYGGPTRLLDWTKSALIACYFACCNESDKGGAIYWFNPERLASAFCYLWDQSGYPRDKNGQVDYNQRAFEPIAEPLVGSIFFTNHPISRANSQRGLFTICLKLGELHDKVIYRMFEEVSAPDDSCGRIVIPSHLKREAFDQLHNMGIDAASINYPGADIYGLGQSTELLSSRKRQREKGA